MIESYTEATFSKAFANHLKNLLPAYTIEYGSFLFYIHSPHSNTTIYLRMNIYPSGDMTMTAQREDFFELEDSEWYEVIAKVKNFLYTWEFVLDGVSCLYDEPNHEESYLAINRLLCMTFYTDYYNLEFPKLRIPGKPVGKSAYLDLYGGKVEGISIDKDIVNQDNMDANETTSLMEDLRIVRDKYLLYLRTFH